MVNAKYSLIAIFTIAAIIFASIFFISFYNQAQAQTPTAAADTENELYRQTPRDNDDNYSLPTYIPAPSQGVNQQKVEFSAGSDNDALYYNPAYKPITTPKKRVAHPLPREKDEIIPASGVEVEPQQPQPRQSPAAPLQPQPRQPQVPVYVPQYQQPQYQQPQYQQPAPQPSQQDEESYPYYYY